MALLNLVTKCCVNAFIYQDKICQSSCSPYLSHFCCVHCSEHGDELISVNVKSVTGVIP